jgi:cytoskeletal protein CcmA (bactofilin family)
MSVKGDLVSDNIIEIFGKVEGKIKSDVLSIREGALVKGNIASKYVKIAGAFEGDVIASIIHITSTGTVIGNLTYGIISIEEKGKFEGSINQKTELLEIKSVEEQNEVKSDE